MVFYKQSGQQEKRQGHKWKRMEDLDQAGHGGGEREASGIGMQVGAGC